MISDPVTNAGLVTREIRSGFREGAATKIAVARRTYSTDQTDLWDAITNPSRIPRWFLPVDGDLDEGGRYQLEGNAGGIIERCDAPESFSATWEYGEMVSWLTVTLNATEGGTILELVHEAPVDPEMWDQFGSGAVGVGWDLGLLGLGLYLESGRPVDPQAAAGFTATPEGTQFVQAAAAGWADAAVSDGDDPASARAAAARTVDFYTAVPEDDPGTE